jgi:hypothetical protein
MAALWWHSQIRKLGETLDINGLKNRIAEALRESGFTDVHVNDLEVAGGKGGVWASVAHFSIEPEIEFWEITMTAGDDSSTKTVNDEVVALLNNIHDPGGSP